MVEILLTVSVLVVLEMLDPAVMKLSIELSQRTTDPVKPLNVKVVEFDPAQTVTLPPEMVPLDEP